MRFFIKVVRYVKQYHVGSMIVCIIVKKVQHFYKIIKVIFKLFECLHLQLMLDLNNHPELYDIFMNGFHIIQQSDSRCIIIYAH